MGGGAFLHMGAKIVSLAAFTSLEGNVSMCLGSIPRRGNHYLIIILHMDAKIVSWQHLPLLREMCLGSIPRRGNHFLIFILRMDAKIVALQHLPLMREMCLGSIPRRCNH